MPPAAARWRVGVVDRDREALCLRRCPVPRQRRGVVRTRAPKVIEDVLVGDERVRFEFAYFDTEVSRHARPPRARVNWSYTTEGHKPSTSPGFLILLIVVLEGLFQAAQYLCGCLAHRPKLWLVHLSDVLAQVNDDLL